MQPGTILAGIKLLHTLIWLFFVSCILAIPIAAARHKFRDSLILSALVAAECFVIVIHGGHCPLTDLASRYTSQRSDNFDIYLPLWLARYNKAIFGSLFAAGEIYLLVRRLASRA